MKPFTIVERGTGTPLVLVPGIQGRWEYSRELVEALARTNRVITFSLCDERTPGDAGPGPRIDVFASQVDAALDQAGVASAAIVGVSFGALVALRLAATRTARVRALVMISAPGPQWRLQPRHEWYARAPWLFGPMFLAESPFRLHREVVAAIPDRQARRRYVGHQLRTAISAPVSVSRMAARARLIGRYDRVADARAVTAPTLIVQGDPALDHVTGSGGTADYARLIGGSQLVTLEQTGHLGSMTRAGQCAAIVHQFLSTAARDAEHSAA